jgi:hypothetical protein
MPGSDEITTYLVGPGAPGQKTLKTGTFRLPPPTGGDDTAMIAAVVNEAQAAGSGIVKAGPYDYKFTTVPVSANNIVIEGTGDMGDTGTSFRKTNATGYGFTFTGQNSGLRNLMIRQDPTVTVPTAGGAASFTNCFEPLVENVRIADTYNGVLFQSCLNARVQGSIWLLNTFGDFGLQINGGSGIINRLDFDCGYQIDPTGKRHGARPASTALVAGDTYTNNGLIFQVRLAGTTAAGAGPTTVPGTTVLNSRTTDVVDGTATVRFVGRVNTWLDFAAGGGWTLQSAALLNGGTAIKSTSDSSNWLFVGHVEIDHPYNDGVELVRGSGFYFGSRSWVSSSLQGNGVRVRSTYKGETSLGGGRIFGNALNGIDMEAGARIVNIHDMQIGCNGTLTANTYAGILVRDGSTRFNIHDNMVGDTHTVISNTQQYGISLLGATSDKFKVKGNYVGGNVSGGVNSGYTPGASRIVAENWT